MLRVTKTLDAAQADHLWALARSLEGTVRTFTASPADDSPAELQRAVDRAATGATAAVLVPALPAIGGVVTRYVVGQVTDTATEAARTGIAVAAVLAVCRVAGVDDDVRALGVVSRAVAGRDLPPGWEPPERRAVSGPSSAWRGARDLAGISPHHGAGWQRTLGMLPVVGVLGASLAGQRTVQVVLSRACTELGLPQPSAGSAARTVAHGAAAVRRFLPRA